MRTSLAVCICAAAALVLTGCGYLSPLPPEEPSGPSRGSVGEPYRFSTTTTDPQGDNVAFRFDWGGEYSDWTEFVPSGVRVSAGHSWDEAGEYAVRAQARDICGFVSDWSDPHVVTIGGGQGGYPDSLVNTVAGIADPVGIAPGPDGQFVYVSARGENRLVVIRTSDDAVLARVVVGSRPHAVCVLPDGRYAYVANCGSDNVSVVRVSDNTVVATVPVGDFPIFCTALPNSEYVYVSNYYSGTVSVIRTSDNTVTATVAVGPNVWGSAVTPDGRFVYAGLSGSPQLKMIRTSDNTVSGTVSVHTGPEGMSILPGGEYLYVACRTGGGGPAYIDVVRLSDNTVVASTPVGGYPVDVVPLPNGQYVYVGCHVSGDIHALSTETRAIVWSQAGASGPCYIAAPSNRRVYVCCNFGNEVRVLGMRERPRPGQGSTPVARN